MRPQADKQINVGSNRDLLSTLSSICDEVYHQAPSIRNELVNRRELSSAAASARMRLIEGLLASSSLPFLGMNSAKAPPEMSMYLSILHRGNMHVQQDTGYTVVEPTKDDPLNVRPTFARICEVLQEKPDARIPVAHLFDALRQPPFGVRDGLLPLLLAVFAVIHEQELAFYEDGGFLRQVTGAEFMRLVKEPTSFEIQYCRVAGVRASVFARLAKILRPDAAQTARPASSTLYGHFVCLPLHSRSTRTIPSGCRRKLRLSALRCSAHRSQPCLFSAISQPHAALNRLVTEVQSVTRQYVASFLR